MTIATVTIKDREWEYSYEPKSRCIRRDEHSGKGPEVVQPKILDSELALQWVCQEGDRLRRKYGKTQVEIRFPREEMQSQAGGHLTTAQLGIAGVNERNSKGGKEKGAKYSPEMAESAAIEINGRLCVWRRSVRKKSKQSEWVSTMIVDGVPKTETVHKRLKDSIHPQKWADMFVELFGATRAAEAKQ
ncbi:MAG: hypothetical protein NTV70_09925 [Acidobacteria bacterium]|nr:hypothetical protein [Acidobacteriota bacterium]